MNQADQDITDNPLVATSYTYTGREYDKASGLYYYRARYYDSSSGRFLAVDPDQGNIDSPISITNKYAYVENDPANFIDPDGETKIFAPWNDTYGNWCGLEKPGQTPDGTKQTPPPKDNLDSACQKHDRDTHIEGPTRKKLLRKSIADFKLAARMLSPKVFLDPRVMKDPRSYYAITSKNSCSL